ncbi:MAG: cytochrome b [Rhodospirillales bacterium]
MAARNTKERYGAIAQALHWIVALLFLGAYCAVYYRHWFTVKKTPENIIAAQLHFSFGITIAVFVLLRVLYRLWDMQPDPPAGPLWQRICAKVSHYGLYFFMIAMPLTGYLGTGANTKWFYLFEVPSFKSTAAFKTVVEGWMGLTWKAFEAPLDAFHHFCGESLVWMLIAIHVCAALYHHYHLKDTVLTRMMPGK